jgi:hypothetical protein
MDTLAGRNDPVHPQKESEMNGKRTRRVGTVVVMTAMLAVLAVPTSLPAAAVNVPDQVLAWNQYAYDELIVTKLQAPPVSVLNLAIVHGAVYDAVNAIDGGYEPYLVSPSAARNASEDAAAAAAAYQVLLNLIPDRASVLLGDYNASLAAILGAGVSQARIDAGVAVGEAAAAAMILERTGDGRNGTAVFSEGTLPGEWRRVPLVTGGNAFRWIGQVDPFLVNSAAQFATVGPKELSSEAYAEEFEQVKKLGRATGSTRTPNQTSIALFWTDHAVAMWTRIFRQISIAQDLSTAENARFFASLYLTGADAAITCFEDKETKHFWRPQTAIQEAENDENPATHADPAWTSLLPNPPYPDHPSGHNCVSGSFVRTLQQFFGTNVMSFSATHSMNGITRSFTRFGQAISEIKRARVYGGLHFWSADAQGARLGRRVANWRQEHYFQPVD